MSTPMPAARTSGQPGGMIQISPQEQDEWDAPLIALTQKSRGDLRRLMYAFFSFLNRRTDFYMIPPDDGPPSNMGFKEGDAEKLLLAAFRQFPLRRIPSAASIKARQEKEKADKGRTERIESSEEKIKEEEGVSKKSSLASTEQESDATASKQKPETQSTFPPDMIDLMAGVRYSEDRKQIPVDNGGSTPKYQWTQSLYEASVILPLPVKPGTTVKAKDLSVSLKATSLSIAFKDTTKFKDVLLSSTNDNTSILEGNFSESIRPDDSTWTIETSNNDEQKGTPTMLLVLDKVKKTWWRSILKGDEEIDTELVDSTRKIGEYDESTQGAIRKIMFDQQQHPRGLPSSDEILAKEGKGVHTLPQGRSVNMDLPTGVEFIDSETLKAADASKNSRSST